MARGLTLLLATLPAATLPALAQGASLSVDVKAWSAAVAIHCGDTKVAVRQLGDNAALAIDRPVEVPSTLSFELATGAHAVSLESRECWAPERRVNLGGGPETVRVALPVWKRTLVTGKLSTPRGTSLPRELRFTFSPPFAESPSDVLDNAIVCAIAESGGFRCRPPSARLDLRISLPGFAPVYRWGLELPADRPLDLGILPLVAGASLSGWLMSEEGGAPAPAAVRLHLVPAGLAENTTPREAEIRKTASISGNILESGFFQFDSLAAGSYYLVAGGPTLAEVKTPVTLVEGRESQLREPLLLARPFKASFIIEPPVGPGDRPWRIAIRRINRYRNYAQSIVEAEVPLNGWFEADLAHLDQHLVSVLTADGDAAAAREINPQSEPMPVTIAIGAIQVAGRLLLGRDGLAGTISFGGKYGREKVVVSSDAEGAYSASLPRAGTWRVHVEAAEPPVERKLPRIEITEPEDGEVAEVDIELPDTRLFGTVRQRNGKVPRTPTFVYALAGPMDRTASQRIDKQGRFDFRGLSEGSVRLHAWSAEGRSTTVLAQLGEGHEHEIALILDPQLEVNGLVAGEAGPVPGAMVQVQPVHDPLIPIPRTACDGNGRFTISLPEATTEVFVTVSAPGSTLSVHRASVRENEDLLVPLSQHGGTLALALPAEWQNADRKLVVFRDGSPLAPGEIVSWAALHPDREQTPTRFTVPNLAAGRYEVCNVRAEDFAYWLYGFRDSELCASGTVSALGQLSLTLPSPVDG